MRQNLNKNVRVKGRTDDMMIIRGVNVFPSEVERVLLQDGEDKLVPIIKFIVKKRCNGMVELHVEIDSMLNEKLQGI